ncbi:MAG: Asp23/Gls24 family envelope stress response protein [Pseudonocardiaceae bacterium]
MAVNETHIRRDALPHIAVLACGRNAAEVWERAAAGRQDTHSHDCPHCQAVAEDQRRLATAIAALREEALEPPPSLVDRVMGAVLAELRPASYLPLPTRRGRARIDRVAAAGVLRHAVDQMFALRVRSCQIRIPEPFELGHTSHATLVVSPSPAWVHITVTARFGTDLISTTARVRQMILAAAEDLLGLPLDGVDVEVVDIFEDSVRYTW